MRALVATAPGKLEIANIPQPVIGEYEALVKIEVCGICNSTDTKLIDGTMYWAPPYPFVLGHESVGVLVETGARVSRYSVGDRVTRPIYRAPATSAKMNSANGGFAEFGVVTDNAAMARDGDESMLGDYNADRQIVVPPQLSAVEAALCISLSETASLLDSLPNMAGKSVLVAGTGVAALSFAMWAKLAGARTAVLGRRAKRLAIAKKLGADALFDTRESNFLAQVTSDFGAFDVLMEGTGSIALANSLRPLLKSGGAAIAYGVPPTGNSYADFWQSPTVNEHHRYYWVADLVARGWVKPEWFVSHEWPFVEALTAFAQTRAGDVFKGFVDL